MKISTTKEIRKISILIFWMLIWELCSLFINNSLLLPSPLEVIEVLVQLVKKIYFWECAFNSVLRVIAGVSLSIGIGIFIGIIAAVNKFIEELLEPLIVCIKATPVMSIIILALVWFKASNVVIFTSVLTCFPIIYTNVLEGIKAVDKNLIEMASVYKVKNKYIIKDIYLPYIKHYIVSGVLMCLGMGWKVSVASEVLSIPKYSIGLNLLNAKSTLETAELFAWTIVIVALSFIFEIIFKYYIKGQEQ
ncbi:ABC transporter permease [Clostridium carboxidivorans P7]|uniref:Binding-protein-dependent transport systems inner membrane component n=1 Tax=Clostridium carboxidivorans P7 TaxID=536227 RepID=C6PPX6_9CLOT|nr:ABC transporter permease subunit [Clostridium carboxidivorans]AKN31104.1 ABC transporter permease [Clostridium carboxidivorans P7]EET88717.1 binding-protein-dependent transport systems inner membrane component [Clostridium carboxidivorans P7]EFG88627.1 ABC transporter, permease protein [Clostridium carboxidivorans P7]